MHEVQKISNLIENKLDFLVDAAFDSSFRILEELGITLYDNQEEIVENVLDLKVRQLLIAQARAGGKTFAVEVGLLYLCVDNPGLRVGVVGPKLDQATRLIKELQGIIKKTKYEPEIDWENTSAAKIYFKNGSYILGLSGSKTAEVEGHHFDVLVVDEAHRVSSFAFENKLLPMLGGSSISKVVKLGVTMFKGHFWKSARSNSAYKKLIRGWQDCPFLLKGGSVVVNGVEYSKFVLDRMPLSLKEQLFPDRPDLHYEGDMPLIDFMTQYMMQWAENLNTFLDDKDQDFLIGQHNIEEVPVFGAHYFYGLDTQKGTLTGETAKQDYTALSIWKKLGNNVKQKVACFEWQQNPLDQQEEIIQIITEIFPCDFGLIDYSNNGVMMLEEFRKNEIPGDGVVFNSKEPFTGLNYKNAMYTHFLFELRHGRVQYPIASEIENDVIFNKHFNQWCMLERVRKMGINDDIRAPEGEHDDGCLGGNTLIPLVDGKKFTMVQLSKMDLSDKYVYSVDLNTMLVQPGKIKRCWKTGRKKVIKIVFDNNKYLECTEDHLILMRDGTYKEAKDVKCNDSLMPLYKRQTKGRYEGYEMIRCLKSGRYIGTHKMFVLGSDYFKGLVVHHKDYNKKNNNPNNLEVMTSSEHKTLHNNDFWKTLSKEERSKRNKKSWQKYSKEERRKIMRSGHLAALKAGYSEETRKKNLEWTTKRNADPAWRKAHSEKMKKYWANLIPEEKACRVQERANKGGAVRKGKVSWNKGKHLSEETRKKISETRKKRIKEGKIIPWNKGKNTEGHKHTVETKRKMSETWKRRLKEGKIKPRIPWNKGLRNCENNHKVKGIIDEEKYIDVYDMEVEDYHNFAIDSGIFVHNCDSDILAVFACDKKSSFKGRYSKRISRPKRLPGLVTGVQSISNPIHGRKLR